MATNGRPNILFLFPDQHRYDWVGWNKDLPLRTPNLDKLAGSGTTFSKVICNSPLCAPSRSSLAQGVNYRRCQTLDNADNTPLDRPLVYQHLRDAGYRVASVGKVDLHKGTPEWHADGSSWLERWGFTDGSDSPGKHAGVSNRANGRPDPYIGYLEDRGLASIHCADLKARHNFTSTDPTPLPDEAYSDNWIAQNCIDVISSIPVGEPWFMQVNYTGPHEPMDVTKSMHDRWSDVDFPLPNNCQIATDATEMIAPGSEVDRYTTGKLDKETHNKIRRNYASMIENIDTLNGRILDVIESRGELSNTLIVYSSDHGEMLGDHNDWEKFTYYHPSLCVPLVIRGPGVKAGASSLALTQLIDLTATFLDYARADPLPDADGMSLRPVLEGHVEQVNDYVFSGLENREGGPIPGSEHKLCNFDLVWDGRYKLVSSKLDDGTMLFDLKNDPLEHENIADAKPDIVARLRNILDNELARTP